MSPSATFDQLTQRYETFAQNWYRLLCVGAIDCVIYHLKPLVEENLVIKTLFFLFILTCMMHYDRDIR